MVEKAQAEPEGESGKKREAVSAQLSKDDIPPNTRTAGRMGSPKSIISLKPEWEEVSSLPLLPRRYIFATRIFFLFPQAEVYHTSVLKRTEVLAASCWGLWERQGFFCIISDILQCNIALRGWEWYLMRASLTRIVKVIFYIDFLCKKSIWKP